MMVTDCSRIYNFEGVNLKPLLLWRRHKAQKQDSILLPLTTTSRTYDLLRVSWSRKFGGAFNR
ncbi:hypothetical protein OK016_03520 [Vibrio chagasii]|nr:hypothetical protein [Vibrio chagasii]